MILTKKSDRTPLEDKRKELSKIVRTSGSRIQRTRLRTNWDVCSNGTSYHCGHVTLGRKGNIITLYTPEKESRRKPVVKFNAVEVYVLDMNYEKLAYSIASRLMDSGYETKIKTDLERRIRGSKS